MTRARRGNRESKRGRERRRKRETERGGGESADSQCVLDKALIDHSFRKRGKGGAQMRRGEAD